MPFKTVAANPPQGLNTEHVDTQQGKIPLSPREGPFEIFGRTYVYNASPTFETGIVLQKENTNPQAKIKLKDSTQIHDTPFGAMPAQLPRLPQNDYTSHWLEYYQAPWERWDHPGDFLPKNLIDGDLTTEWCSREQSQPDAENQWIRIDLPVEQELHEIKIHPCHLMKLEQFKGFGLPGSLTVKLSRDAWHWTSVRTSEPIPPEKMKEPVAIKLNQPLRAKQVWIVGDQLRSCNLPFGGFGGGHYYFMCGGVEIIDSKGENVALGSRGSGVQVSSTYYGPGDNWEIYEYLWPTIWDQGFSWARVSGWGGTLLWSAVEREKGKYIIDSRSDEAIGELVRNGVKPTMILGYNNSLYDQGGWIKFALAGEAKQAFIEYCRFMAKHFKRRVACYEIWNEPGIASDEQLAIYCRLLRDAAEVIRQEDPDALISFAGLGMQFYLPEAKAKNYSSRIFDRLLAGDFLVSGINVAKLVDAFGWHAQGEARYGEPNAAESFASYRRGVKTFGEAARAHGFKGILNASEFWLGAAYPPYGVQGLEFAGQQSTMTEIRKAKDTARLFMFQAGMGVISFWCNNWFTQVQWDDGFFRSGFAADPVSPVQPEALYYVMRNLCTLMQGAKPSETVAAALLNRARSVDIAEFILPDGAYCIGLWLTDKSGDFCEGFETDLSIKGIEAGEIFGVDTLNGFEQKLNYRQRQAEVIIPNILIRDYPLLLRIEPKG